MNWRDFLPPAPPPEGKIAIYSALIWLLGAAILLSWAGQVTQ